MTAYPLPYARLLRLLAPAALGCLLPLKAHALIGGNLSCTVTGSNTSGYTFAPGADINVAFSGTCTVRRLFPRGAATNLQIRNTSGSNPATLRVADRYNNIYMSELPLGSFSTACLGGPCARLPVGTQIPYTYYIIGKAPNTPGTRITLVNLGVTSIGFANYAEWIHPVMFTYVVRAPSCALSSPGTVNLRFGAISNASLSDQRQSTSVSINCASETRASVSLVPSQRIVSATTGVSATSLAGLNMQALWTDTFNPVNFQTPRTMQLGVGSNAVNLSFKPQLAAGQAPIGAFQSQYTLNIDYQ